MKHITATLFLAWCFLQTVHSAFMDVVTKDLGLEEAIRTEEGHNFGDSMIENPVIAINALMETIQRDPAAKASFWRAVKASPAGNYMRRNPLMDIFDLLKKLRRHPRGNTIFWKAVTAALGNKPAWSNKYNLGQLYYG